MDACLKLPPRYNASEVLFQNLDKARGDKVAVICGDRRVSYAQLADMAGRVGNGLKELGLRRGSRALLLLLDTPEFPATFFGAVRAGFIPVPANTVLQSADYEYLLKDSQAEVAVVQDALYPKIEPIRDRCPNLKHIIVVDGSADSAIRWGDWLPAVSPDLAPADTHPEDVAFWLYSSGSTGFPKGVVHLHRHIPYTMEAFGKHIIGIQEDDITFSASKAFHAYGLGNSITFPYSVGASTVLFPGRPTAEAAFEQIHRHRPTLFFTVPTLYAAMLAIPDAEERWDLSSLRLCVSAAEALPAEIYRQWLTRFGVEILDGIGSTEMLHTFISNRPGQVRPGSSGVLVPGYEAKIVDEQGRPVRCGESGDLLVKGGSAAPYYWNRPEKTAETMRGEWVFTGDRYHQDADGYFYHHGRSDDMMKVGGQWVSPVEVESTLIQHPSVLESAVVPFRDATGLTKPKAFVVLSPGHRPSARLAEELKAFVKSRLAPYKYPRRIEFVPELPKTATGKIQRFRLREH